jgi:hypothetical protein
VIPRALVSEARSQLRSTPFSTVASVFVVPFVAAALAGWLPRAQLPEKLHLQKAALSFSGPASARPVVERLQAELAARGFYEIAVVPSAKESFARGEADLALVVEAIQEPGLPLRLTATALRHRDFLSDLFMEKLERVRRQLEVEGAAQVPPVLVPDEREKRQGTTEKEVRYLAPILLFLLAWIALATGLVDLVAERERRTLEILLSESGRARLAWGLLLFHVLRSLTMLLASLLGLMVSGASPWILSLLPVAALALFAAVVPLFWWLRDLEQAVSGFLRVGTLTALSLPFVLFTSLAASPLRALGDVLSGPPAPLPYLRLLGALAAAAALAAWRLPKVAARWSP